MGESWQGRGRGVRVGLPGSWTRSDQTWQVGDLLLEAMWQVKYFIFSLSQDLWPLNLIECWLRGGGLTRKRLSRHQLFLPYLSAIFFQIKSRFLNRVKSTFFYFFLAIALNFFKILAHQNLIFIFESLTSGETWEWIFQNQWFSVLLRRMHLDTICSMQTNLWKFIINGSFT